jgi:hypothetical protein
MMFRFINFTDPSCKDNEAFSLSAVGKNKPSSAHYFPDPFAYLSTASMQQQMERRSDVVSNRQSCINNTDPSLASLEKVEALKRR